VDATIPLNDATRRILDEVPRSDFPLVFPGRDGKVRTNAHKSLTRIKTLAALPDDFRILHGCRHVFASTGVSNGIDLYTMQHLLTHKSPAMTQRYAHLADDHLKRASERTARILAGGNMESVIDLGGNRQKRQA
jgi:site-specific recombinase XerD